MAPAELSVVHDTRYDYATAVSQAHHLAHLRPLQDAHQALLDFVLVVEPDPGDLSERVDAFGNITHHFSLVLPHRSLRVRSQCRLRVSPRFEALDAAASPAWDDLRDKLHYVARAPYDPAVGYVQPSPFVPRLEALRAYGRAAFPVGRPVAEGAIDLMHRIRAEFVYRSQATQVDTPVAEALERRTGVCQDFAHVMIGALRMLGLPARYVSGYLLTNAASDGHALVGADASHAWVQVQAPGTPGVPDDGWLDLDPTNDTIPTIDHIRVAIGRDYGDVAPLRGVIRGGGRHTLSVGVTTRRNAPPAAAGPVVA